MSYFDIIIITILLLNIGWGYKKGLIKTLLSFTSYLAAIILSRMYYKTLAEWIQANTTIFSRIESIIFNNYEAMSGNWNSPADEGIASSIKTLDIIKAQLINENSIESYAYQAMETVKTEIVTTIASFFINVLSLVIIFVVVRFVILLIGSLLNVAFDFPLLKPINGLGGMLVGLIRGVLIVLIIILILIPWAIKNPMGAIASGIEGSIVLEKVFNVWLLLIIERITSL
ncbi:CvpA family protein [Alkaliphilus peptidifermentans]|uniref:Colicin V production protein n=1 Tax=Alkaliphilus peptidifermentans DSM 18978 TaxID=1120976 RepID=A0A1G5HFA7_9FIRM|nr:CvpA family protein [Alkaliphilus peptidifermentans]SCY62522.1 Colicin V production protein [Alkaliphilus peptidifermentans DSM 18978]